MKYTNTRTGAIIESLCVLYGKHIKRVDDKPDAKDMKYNDLVKYAKELDIDVRNVKKADLVDLVLQKENQ